MGYKRLGRSPCRGTAALAFQSRPRGLAWGLLVGVAIPMLDHHLPQDQSLILRRTAPHLAHRPLALSPTVGFQRW
mgnify:CR=1 FL=1